MKYILLFCFQFIFQINFVYSQNLVPNGSFENFSQCPYASSQIYFASGWFQPHKYPGYNVNNSSSSDYLNSCSPLSGLRVPHNNGGYQAAKTGNAYIGLSFYSPTFNQNDYREYAEVMLSQELQANKKYNLTYYISMANESRYSITKFDAYLSNDSLIYISNDFSIIPVTPQFQYNARIDDTLNWVQVSGSFVASGGERFLTLGNFHDGALCDSLTTPPATTFFCCSAFYFIDDVSLEEDTITGINEISKTDFTVYPNPARNTVRISSEHSIMAINLKDLRGKPLIRLSQTEIKKETEIDVSSLDNGVYIVECRFKNGEAAYKKIVVLH